MSNDILRNADTNCSFFEIQLYGPTYKLENDGDTDVPD